MKYIKLFESFESGIITNTIKFLSSKLSKSEVKDFTIAFNKLMTRFDIPLSSISDDDIEYTRTKNAIDIKSDDNVDNIYGIYCIKYWFSMEKGFLGQTGTGNLKTLYTKIYKDYGNKNKNFTEEQLLFINDVLKLKKGKLISVLDYNNLKTGDDVVLVINDDSRDICKGKIFIDKVGNIFVYQNLYSGRKPPNEEKPNFASKYNYSWGLVDSNNVSTDHKNLHIYIKDTKKLRQESNNLTKSEYKPNPGDNNKPIDYDKLIDWSIYDQDHIKTMIEDSDFSIIIYFDKLINRKKRSTVKKEREDSKKDATALMSDNEIRVANINRLYTNLVLRYGISKDMIDLSKLNKVVNNTLGNKYIIFSIYIVIPLNSLRDLNDSLYDLVKFNGRHFNQTVTKFTRIKKESQESIIIYKRNIEMVKDSGNLNLIKIIDRVLDLGIITNNLINNIEISTINDLIMLEHKLRSLKDFLDNSKYSLFRYGSVIYNIDSSNSYSIRTAISNCEYETEENFNESMDRLDIIERYINSLLK